MMSSTAENTFESWYIQRLKLFEVCWISIPHLAWLPSATATSVRNDTLGHKDTLQKLRCPGEVSPRDQPPHQPGGGTRAYYLCNSCTQVGLHVLPMPIKANKTVVAISPTVAFESFAAV
jgi:hypothetical protein